MRRIIPIFFVIIVLSAFFFGSACKKNDEDKDQTAAMDNSTAENAFNDVFKQVDDAARQTSEAGTQKVTQLDSTGCATVTITPFDTVTWPKTLTIDFGDWYCLCSDGRYRKGKIIASLSGRYRDSATVITVSLEQYYVNNYHIEGAKTITNKGHIGTSNGTQNLVYDIDVTNAVITSPEGKQITWQSNRLREWIESENTISNLKDDVYLITGNALGVDQNGKDYTVNITSPLRVALDCEWIESGTVEIAPEDLAIRTVDFGASGCDANASVTINGITYDFVMN
jgi:hypothetical protein